MLQLNGYFPLDEEAIEYTWMAHNVCKNHTRLLVQHGHDKASLPRFVGVYGTVSETDTVTYFLERRLATSPNPEHPTWVDWHTSWHLWQFDLREMPCFIERKALHGDVVQQIEKQQ